MNLQPNTKLLFTGQPSCPGSMNMFSQLQQFCLLPHHILTSACIEDHQGMGMDLSVPREMGDFYEKC